MVTNWSTGAMHNIKNALELHDAALRSKQSIEMAQRRGRKVFCTHSFYEHASTLRARANDAMRYIDEACDAISITDLINHILKH